MKKILFSFLLSLVFVSCRNDVINPSNVPQQYKQIEKENKTESYNTVKLYKKEEIDRKYPYWKVGVSDFLVSGKNDYIELTVEEKKFFLEALALMRLTINTEEFVQVYKANQNVFLADKTVEKGKDGAIYGSQVNEKFDIDRLIEVIRATEYDVYYVKASHKKPAVYGILGSYYYSYYGSSVNLRVGSRIFVHNNYIPHWYGLSFFSALMYHEHLHNIGFTHNKNVNFYEMQSTMRDLANRIFSGDLKDKYKSDLDELTSYYLDKYKDLLVTSTIYYPNK